MADDPTTYYAREQEVAELRDEIRRLREEQEHQKQHDGNGHDGQGQQAEQKKDEQDKKDEQEPPKKPHPVRNAILIGAAVVLAIAGFLWWRHSSHFEGTDDAFVDGHLSAVAARIAGTVTGVYAEENQFVKAGQTLVDLDPHDFQAALDQALGALSQARSQVQVQQPNVPVTEVTNTTNIATSADDVTRAEAGLAGAQSNYQAALEKIHEAEANNAKAQADIARYRPLAEKDEVPKEQFDQVVANAKALAATVAANQASAAAASKQVDDARAQVAEARKREDETRQNAGSQLAIRQATVRSSQAGAESARAQVEQARLNLSYCKIASPVDGIVAKRTAEIGYHTSPGQQLLLITATNDLWVTANYRETQLRRMHAGQTVRIHVDAIDADFDGYLESMPAASGSVTSLLPPENATGNFVKIVQRLPVRIRFKQNQAGLERLRPGMSVEPSVRID